MSGLEPFAPDDDYCVYCHAPAAGMCAECGALCCPDCTELVMGWTTRQAVCSQCVQSLPAPTARLRRMSPWIAGLVAAALAAGYLVAR